jgi:cysteinyl-tRNA synthetase
MQLQDTLTNTRRELLPALAPDGVVRLYVCGVTPYSESHVGHALHAIVFDVLRRYLDWRGIPVRHVQNFTDIDDKLIERSSRLGVPMLELAEQTIADYHRQLQQMNVQPAHEYPRVTEVVPQIIDFINGLIEKDFAYESGGDVYYRVRKFGAAAYGALSKRDIDDLLSEMAAAMMKAMFADRYLTLSLSGKRIENTNGVLSEDKSKVTWRLPLASLVAPTQDNPLTVEADIIYR